MLVVVAVTKIFSVNIWNVRWGFGNFQHSGWGINLENSRLYNQ